MEKFEEILKKIKKLEGKIGYTFKDKNNIILALTHSSYANEYKSQNFTSNERLEFLGDTVLNMIISEDIYNKYYNLSEGEMTKFRSNVICEASLARCAKNINIGEYLLLGKGEENTGGRSRISILSDSVEALIGALYLDAGIERTRFFVLNHMGEMIEESIKGIIFMDYKTQLQEILQRSNEKKVVYEIIDEKGPDHNKVFISQVKIDDRPAGRGKGRTKKEAEQMAAKETIESINKN
ncbi:ribonuclease III [Herbivorax sp. ANBcel31]|uniref:ribonuclease III n=1 Tax=Herbivorax sp. ANBcel31 TaxID=3069754 RepID=UPI0027AF7EAD|nr:ribonuclease III [Herbivorax sp. ANBcel31]MDQ2085261.1 ribonuclease III [Herbivorax sp. ANBcel31]